MVLIAPSVSTTDPGVSHVPESWSPSGDRLLFDASSGASVALSTFSVPDRKTERFGTARSSFLFSAAFSPDGRWVAYAMYGSDTTGIFVASSFPSGGARFRISTIGIHPLWSPNGKELFYSQRGGFPVVLPVTTARGFEFGSPVQIPRSLQSGGTTALRAYDIMPDGKRLIGIVPSDPDTAGVTAQLQVVLNWHEELKKQFPPTR